MAILAMGIVTTVVVLAGDAAVQAQQKDAVVASPGAPIRVVTKEIEPFVFVGDDWSGFSIELSEGSLLRAPINRALLQLREDGTYDLIYAKWFDD
ncbi:MAG: hypothetical protein ACK2UO_07665 [Caldilineaceae bacterium]